MNDLNELLIPYTNNILLNIALSVLTFIALSVGMVFLFAFLSCRFDSKDKEE